MDTLSHEERRFFALVSQAVRSNPFSEERIALDLEIAGLFPGVSDHERLSHTIKEVAGRIERLEQQSRADVRRYRGQDLTLVRNAVLFDVFHRFLTPFDQHIQAQLNAGEQPCKVNFADDAIALLRRRGFSKADAKRYFALCFQLRRAFFFIDRNLVGSSTAMRELRRKLWNNVFTYNIDLYNEHLWNRMEDFSTLLLGETGTGKGTAAAAIGRSGFIPFDERSGCFAESFMRGFVPINLAQYPETLIESELFGHRKGAFTGAVEDYLGVFDRCSPHGAIFLDEIGEVSRHIQVKLLQVIQERRFRPVGSHQERRFQGRVIAATNRSMAQLRQQHALRDDFYYRLCSDVITVPPLHQRIQQEFRELDELLHHTVKRILGRPSPELSHQIQKVLVDQVGPDYSWPGNVRELEQSVRQILLNRTCQSKPEAMQEDLLTHFKQGFDEGRWDAQGLIAAYCQMLYARHGTLQAVARRVNLDWRTVKKYLRAEPQTAAVKGRA